MVITGAKNPKRALPIRKAHYSTKSRDSVQSRFEARIWDTIARLRAINPIYYSHPLKISIVH